MIIAITGHRPHKLNNEYNLDGPLSKWLKSEIIKILDIERPTVLISGMALGVDTLFSLIGIELQILVHAYIPCENQHLIWPKKSQDIYNKILSDPIVKRINAYNDVIGSY